MKNLLSYVALAATLSLPALAAPPVEREPPEVVADTMIAVDCELILFGRDVRPIGRSGVRGYWVASDDTSVTVNGVRCMSVSTYFPKIDVPPEIEHASRIIERVAGELLRSRKAHGGQFIVYDEVREAGDSFELLLPDDPTPVSVELQTDGMRIRYGTVETRYLFDEAFAIQRDGLSQRLVRTAYLEMVRSLRPGHIVVRGRGYHYSYPLARAGEVRNAIEEIRLNAHADYVDSLGRTVYAPVRTSLGLWVGDLVKEIVEGE